MFDVRADDPAAASVRPAQSGELRRCIRDQRRRQVVRLGARGRSRGRAQATGARASASRLLCLMSISLCLSMTAT